MAIQGKETGSSRRKRTDDHTWNGGLMMCLTRRVPLVGFVVVAAAVIVVAALTAWWVLLALIPLVMMVGCMAMMVAAMGRLRSGDPSMAGRWGCCGGDHAPRDR